MKENHEQLNDWLNRIAWHDDHRAFRMLFETFYPELIRFVSFYVKLRETAEEIVQDIFLKIWIIRQTLPALLNFRAYLFTTARNQSLNFIQKKNPSFISVDDMEGSGQIYEDPDPHQQLEFQDVQRNVQQAVDALPPQCRLIYQLVKEQGFSYKEVSELLSLSPRTVETQIGIALRKIAASLRLSSQE